MPPSANSSTHSPIPGDEVFYRDRVWTVAPGPCSNGPQFVHLVARGLSAVARKDELIQIGVLEAMRRALSYLDGTVEPWADHHYRDEAEDVLRILGEWGYKVVSADEN